MKRHSIYWIAGGVIVAAVAAAIILFIGPNNSDSKKVDNKLTPWELPTADVPGILPGEIQDYAEEKTGIIWIATTNGLVRCDPKKDDWRIFTTRDGLAWKNIKKIHIDRNGKIWFITYSKGFTYYDPMKKIFRTIPITENRADNYKDILEDKYGGLWFYGWQSHFFYCPPGEKELIPQKKDNENSGYIYKMCQDKRGWIWALYLKLFGKIESYVYRFNPEQKKWQEMPLNQLKGIVLMEVDREKNIWFYGDEGVAYYSQEKDELNYIKDSARKNIRIFYLDSKGNTWFGGLKGEITMFNYDEKKIKSWKKISNGKKNTIYFITEDRQGRIWIISGQNIYLSDKNFDRLEKIGPDIKEAQGGIDSIIMGEGNDIWVMMKDGVLYYTPNSSPKWQYYRYRSGLPSTFPFSKRFTLAGQNWGIITMSYLNCLLFKLEDGKQDLWKPIDINYISNYYGSAMTDECGHLMANVWDYDFNTGHWHPDKTILENRMFLYEKIFCAKSENRWILSKYQGVIGIHQNSEIWRPFPYGDKRKALAVFEDYRGRAWISKDDGLYNGDWATRKVEKATIIDTALGNIYSIAESAEGTIWFGAEKAIVRYDPNAKQTEVIHLPQNVKGPITALHEDRTGILWIASGSKLLRYFYKNKKWKSDYRFKDITSIKSIREDRKGVLWFLNANTNYRSRLLYRYNPKTDRLKILKPEIWGVYGITLPDSTGAIWPNISRSISRQTWNEEGIPGRIEQYSPIERGKGLGRISFLKNNKSFTLWRTRLTGLLKSTETIAIPYALDIGFPIEILEKAPDGGVWVGYAMGGIELRKNDGTFKRFETKDGLPNMTILDISQVPGANEPLAWIGTNDGAALVDNGRVRLTVQSKSDPGPVDVTLAMPDGSAYLAFNSISSELFLDPSDFPAQLPRQDTYIKHVKANGEMETTKIEVPRGDVLNMALDLDKMTVWVGTSSGLYRLRNKSIEKIDANGQLQPSSVSAVVVDPKGTIWMGIDGKEQDNKEVLIPATVVGYSPIKNNVRIITPNDGLPEALHIDMLDFTPDGRLSIMADGKLVSGKVFVPGSPFKYWLIGLTIIIVGLSFYSGRSFYLRKKIMEARYTPLVESAREFFAALDKQVKQLDFRTLTIPAANEGIILIRCTYGDMLPVEAIQSAYKAQPKPNGIPCTESYLVFSNALDPAASRQLDVYRLRHHTVIVPLSVSFIRAKLADGPAAVREGWDGLLRRYLGKQDLFDMRNALDEARFFFGRKALIDELFYALNRREHVALTGPRKAGKSSLLNLLYQRLNTYPVIMIDLQLYNRSDELWPQQLFKEIISRYDRWGLARYGSKWNPPPLIEEAAMISGPVFRAALETRRDLQKHLKNDQPLIIMLDEIERLFPQIEVARGDATHLLKQVERFNLFAGVLRALGQEGGDRLISLVIADRQPLFNRVNSFKIPGIDTNPFYRFFQEFYLKPLESPECHEMITEIGHAMGLEVEEDVLNTIYSDSGGFPALARQLASAAASKRGETVKINSSHYDQGISWLQEERGDIDRFFKENFRDVMNNTERRILALAGDEQGVPIETLETAAIPQERERLIEARRDMLAVGILEKIDTNYRVSGALFRQWIKENSMMNDE